MSADEMIVEQKSEITCAICNNSFSEADSNSSIFCPTCFSEPMEVDHKPPSPEKDAYSYWKKTRQILSRSIVEAKKLFSREKRELNTWTHLVNGECCQRDYFLKEEQFECLKELKKEQKKTYDKKRKRKHIKTLEQFMLDVQESLEKSDIEFLQDVKGLLERNMQVMSQRSKDPTDYPITGIVETLNKFRVDITIRPIIATSRVIISEDRKSIRAGESWQIESDHPDDCVFYCLFAEKSFITGSYYWEVDVAQVSQWALGIHTRPLMTNDPCNKYFKQFMFLLRRVKRGLDYYFETYPDHSSFRLKDSIPRIGVFLDYTPGSLHFYNVLKGSLIYHFYPIPFKDPVTPIFCLGPPLPETKSGSMTICSVDSHLYACNYSHL